MDLLWLLFAFLAATFWAINNFLDKLLLNGFSISPLTFSCLANLSSLFPALAVVAFTDLGKISTGDWYLGLALGFLFGTIVYFYGKILEQVDAPVVVILFQTSPVVILILDWMIYGTVFSPRVYLGIALTLIASFVVAIDWSLVFKASHTIEGDRAALIKRNLFVFGLAVFCALLWSTAVWMQEELTLRVSVINVFFLIKLVEFVLGVVSLAIPAITRELKAIPRDVFYKLWTINVIAEAINGTATICLIAAFAYGAMTLVVTISAAQPIIATILLLLVNYLRPGSIPDSKSHEQITLKVTCMVLVVYGIYLVT